MAFRHPKLLIVALFASLALASTQTAAAEPSMIGSWNVRIHADEKAVAAALEKANDQQKLLLQQMIPVMKSMRGTLVVDKDGTYIMTTSVSFGGQEQKKEEKGTWKLLAAGKDGITVETTSKSNGVEKKETHKMKMQQADVFYEPLPDEIPGNLGDAFKLEYTRAK